MHAAFPFERRPLLVRRRYDADELTIVADVAPLTVDDLSVRVGPGVVRLEVEDEHGTTTRSVRPPTERHRFVDDRRAVLRNGVLEVTVGLDRCGSRRTGAQGR